MTNPESTPVPPAPPAPPPPPVIPPGAHVAPPADPEDQRIERLPQWAQKRFEDQQKRVAELSDEAAKKRIAAKEAEDRATQRIQEALRALGVKTDETDPAKIAEAAQAERDAARAELAKARRESLIFRLARPSGANPDVLLNWQPFLDSVSSIDPADVAAITDAIKAAVAATPILAAVAPPIAPPAGGASGGDFTGGPGTGQQLTRSQLAEMSDADIMKALEDGRLSSVVGAK